MRVPLGLALATTALAAPAQQPESRPATREAVLRMPGIQRLTIGGQYRIRYENQIDYDLDRKAGRSVDFFTQRLRLDLDFELDERFGAFLQIQDVREWGEEQSVTDASADGLDVHEAHLRIKDLLCARSETKLGRQTINLGEQRLVSSLDWRSEGRAFDGIRETLRAESAALDLFAFQIDERFATDHGDAYFSGLYAGLGRPEARLEPYVFYLHDEETPSGGTEQRVTLGLRAVRQLGSIELGTELVTQTGEMDDHEIPIGETFAALMQVRWRGSGERAPWLHLEGNLASGDDPSTSARERFNGLFPLGFAYWGYLDLASWENLQHLTLDGGAQVGPRTKLGAYWHFFRAMEETDRFGGPNGTLSNGAPGRSKTMGNEIDLRMQVDFGTSPFKSGCELGYGVFLPGAGAEQSKGADDPAHFVWFAVDVRF